MTKKTFVNISNTTYVAELEENDVYSKNHFDVGRLFRVIDKKGKIVGCISAFISMTTNAVWGEYKLDKKGVENLFLRILPYVKWEVSIDDFSTNYPNCLPIYIHTTDTGYDRENNIHYVRGYESPKELVDNFVFKGEVDEEQVEHDILSFLYEAHLDNHLNYVNTIEMAEALFVDEKLVYRCLDYLYDDGYIKGEKASGVPGFFMTTITTPGFRHVKSNFKKVYAGKEILIMGDYIGNDKIVTSVKGKDNKTIIKSNISNSFNTEVVKRVDELASLIEEKYQKKDKKELLKQLNEVKSLSKNKKNYPKIREIIGGIMTRTSEIATIGSAALMLFQLFTGGQL